MENQIRNISLEIKKMRNAFEWTQKELAKRAKISQSTVCRMETDCSKVCMIFIIKVFNAFSTLPSFANKNFSLREDELNIFFKKIKENDKAWSIVNYDPVKAAKIFIKCVKKEF